MYSVLCTWRLPRCGVTFAHMLTYLTNPHVHSPPSKWSDWTLLKLKYSPVVKIPETKGLLVRQFSARLGKFGLTLWAVSILMYDQEFHHKKLFFSLSLSCHVAANKEHIVPKYHICMNKNIMWCTPKSFNFILIFKFQCKHSHDYNNVLFHVFADCLMPSPGGGADLEHNMRESLMLFIKENREKVTTIAAPFLKKKKLSPDEYIEFMSTQVIRGMSWWYISLL